MKTVAAATSVLLLLGVTSCDRIGALFGHDVEKTAQPSASASAEPAAAASATPPPPPAVTGFEGEIDLTAKGKGKGASSGPIALTMLVKNEAVRIDLPPDLVGSPELAKYTGGGKVYMVMKNAEKKGFVVLDSKQQAITFDMDGLADKAKALRGSHGPGGKDPADNPPKVTKTGKKDTVAGYECEVWDIVNADKSKLSACVTDAGSSFFHFPTSAIPSEHAWALELMDGQHFPVRGIAFDKSGAENGRVEVTKLDKHTLDQAQFEIPAGYKQMTAEEMMQGLGAAPPGDLPHEHEKHHHGGKHHGHH